MAVRSDKLWGPVLIPSAVAWTQLAVVPAGRTWRLSLVVVLNGDNTSRTAWIGLGAAGSELQVFQEVIPAATAREVLRGMVLPPGTRVAALASVANVVITAGFGSSLLGAPS